MHTARFFGHVCCRNRCRKAKNPMMDEYARRNLKDFLTMYNQFTELCFNHCVRNLNYRQLVPEEQSCADRCAEKLINVNHRLITTYMDVNPLHKQVAAMEAAQATTPPSDDTSPSDTAEKPSSLASQVQKVFGSDTVVTDEVPRIDGLQTDNKTQSTENHEQNSATNTSREETPS